MADRVCLMAQIEGVGNATAQVFYCYPVAPDYGTAAYVAGLAEPPSTGSSKYKPERATMSSGRFSLTLRPGVGPVDWLKIAAAPITRTAEAVGLSESFVDVELSNAATAGDVVYIERETWLIVAVHSGDTWQITQGYAGTSPTGSPGFGSGNAIYTPIHAQPPSLTGRKVTIYETPRTGGSASDETVIGRGYISAEPRAGHHTIKIDCIGRLVDARTNRDPVAENFSIARYSLVGGRIITRPTARSTGGMWWFPESDIVIRGGYDTSSASWEFDPVPVIGVTEGEAHTHGLDGAAFEILCSDADQYWAGNSIAPFGRLDSSGAREPTDNPIDIVLNMLLSKAGANYTAGRYRYDLGTHEGAAQYGLYPRYSLGVPIAQVDVDGFERARAVLGDVRARRLWIGGDEDEEFEAVFRRILGPWGFTVGTTRKGVWKILSLGDSFPGASTVVIDNTSITDARSIDMRVTARALDSITIETDPWPDGSNGEPVTIDEISGRRYYPRHVGSAERWKNSPYLASDFGSDLSTYATIANRIRRLGDRIYYVRLTLNAKQFDNVEIGDRVTVHDLSIRDPATGRRMTASSAALKGTCVDVHVNWRRRTAKVTLAITSSGKVALVAPSATVSSWNAGTDVATCEQHDHTRSHEDTDTERFVVGDVARLLGSRGQEIDGAGTAIVSATSTTTLTFGVDSFAVAPVAGNQIIYARHDEVTADQLTRTAYGADDLSGATDHTVGAASVAAYVYGD